MRGKEWLSGYTRVNGCANNAIPETASIPATCFNLQNRVVLREASTLQLTGSWEYRLIFHLFPPRNVHLFH